MRTSKDQKLSASKKELSVESGTSNEESESYSAILGKRSSNESSLEQLKAETEESREQGSAGGDDRQDKRERRYPNQQSLTALNSLCFRLQQNRKSAKKCRLKKKAEYGQMRNDVMKLQDENKNLKEKVYPADLMVIDKRDYDHAISEDGGELSSLAQA